MKSKREYILNQLSSRLAPPYYYEVELTNDKTGSILYNSTYSLDFLREIPV